MRSPLDPELAAAVAMIPVVDISDIAAARASQAQQLAVRLAAADGTGVDVSEAAAPGPDSAPDVTVRIYRPRGVRGPLPALLSLHGGGYVLGSPDVDHDSNLSLCRELGALIVSPGYRLAPEHPFPAGLEDCFAALVWLAKSAAELGVRPERIAVGGDSAGAGLAAALTLLARDRGGPAICFQRLISPSLDDRLETPSARLFTDTPVWNRRSAELSWEAYLGAGARGGAGVSPYAAPGRAPATGLEGLPPAYVAVMESDPLRDEGIDYARSLLGAGVPTELHLFPGCFHGSAVVEHAGIVRRAAAESVAVLRRALDR